VSSHPEREDKLVNGGKLDVQDATTSSSERRSAVTVNDHRCEQASRSTFAPCRLTASVVGNDDHGRALIKVGPARFTYGIEGLHRA
jgi:hypothetical protein